MINRLEQFCNDNNVKDIQNYIDTNKNKFNIFKVLKLDSYEIRHSNFLAWLLNPRENHTLKDDFLQMFLKQAINYNLLVTDDLIVQTEYNTNDNCRIDILLHSKKSDFVCVVENKYGSKEHDEQCKHYKDFIENHSKFKAYKSKYYIFLDIEKPDNEQLREKLYCYEPITYRQVYKILSELLKKHNNLPQEVNQTIEQYKCIIMEKYSMVDEVIKPKCREVLKQYYDVVNKLEDYKKDFQNDMYNLMLNISNEEQYANADIKGNGYNNGTGCGVRFIPTKYINNKNIIKKNSVTNYSVIFALEYKSKLKLGIYEIKTDDKWITHKHIEWDWNIIGKTDNEIKEAVLKAINDFMNDYENIVKTL